MSMVVKRRTAKEPEFAKPVKAIGKPPTAAELEGLGERQRRLLGEMHAEQPKLADQYRRGLSTVTPAGVAALDPEATSGSQPRCAKCSRLIVDAATVERGGDGLCPQCSTPPKTAAPAERVAPAVIKYADAGRGKRLTPAEWKITIDPQFCDLLDPLDEIALGKLRDDLQQRGCLDPLIVWSCTGHLAGLGDTHPARRILLDGHHRFQICDELGIPVEIVELEFSSRAEALAWMRDHQVGRRNITLAKRDQLLAADYAAEVAKRNAAKKAEGKRPKAKAGIKVSPEGVQTWETVKVPLSNATTPSKKAAEVVAEKHGVSPATVKRAAKSQRGKQRVAAAGDADGDWTREEIEAVSSLSGDEYRRALDRGELREAAREAAAKKKKKQRPKHEIELRREAQNHIERYLNTLPARDAWVQSDYLLDALNQWRSRNKTPQSPRRKPR